MPSMPLLISATILPAPACNTTGSEGETLACGSGACATLVAASKQNLSQRKNKIILDGGKLKIHWLESEDVIMSGEVKLVFKGNFYYD